MSPPLRRVSLVSLGCGRNDVDSEELAARLSADGWQVSAADDPSGGGRADVVLVNTCGFVAAAKKDSIDTLLAAADTGASVVAVGCLAERYGATLAAELPEATVLSFDDYPRIGSVLDDVLAGRPRQAHTPTDRRTLLPISPAARAAAPVADLTPGHAPASGPRVLRQRLGGGVVAPLKLASGCDRRCSFCAIPRFRGAFVSRPPQDVLAEAGWLADHGVREVVLVSENSTAYGKDLGDVRLLEQLLPALAATPGLARVRVAYLQPAELRPGLLEALLTTPGVAAYLDLSFQHAAPGVLRAMRRFGGPEHFLDLLAAGRRLRPELGARSNVIAGFPGETRADVAVLRRFLTDARLDAIGVFGYSDEDGTEAATLPGKVPAGTVARRVAALTDLAEQLTAHRAEERVGQPVEVLVEQVGADGVATGRAEHQAPEVDGEVTLHPAAGAVLHVGDLVPAVVTGAVGIDLLARSLAAVPAGTAGRHPAPSAP